MSAKRPAVFLDRDGTLIEDVRYIARREDVRLLAGAAAAVARFNRAGIPVIVVTNQSGIGRGFFTEADYESVRARVSELCAASGATIDASYHCPHAPGLDGTPPCQCRKPGTELFEQAAAEHQIDLASSWFVGDRWRDLAPGVTLGGRGILVPWDMTHESDIERAARECILAGSIGAAADIVLDATIV